MTTEEKAKELAGDMLHFYNTVIPGCVDCTPDAYCEACFRRAWDPIEHALRAERAKVRELAIALYNIRATTTEPMLREYVTEHLEGFEDYLPGGER